MSFVTTQPEALTTAAGNLEGIGTALAAQNAAAAPPTTSVVPAAADPVSALQATQFSAYGNLYQQVSAQAKAIHEMFVHTLGTSADSYGTTEAANSAAAGSSAAGVSGLGTAASAYPPYGPASLASNSSILGAMQAGTIGSAASEFTGLGKGFITEPPGTFAGGSLAGQALVNATAASPAAAPSSTPAATAPSSPAAAAAPVSAGVGQASSVGKLSVPPSWAGSVTPASSAAPATLAGAGWTATAPHSTPVTTLPAGMPAVASAGRGGLGFGTPRYGVKPKVMPRPAVV